MLKVFNLFICSFFILTNAKTQTINCDTIKFNCGYIDSNWCYNNQQLNIKFPLPEGLYVSKNDFTTQSSIYSIPIGKDYKLLNKLYRQNFSTTIFSDKFDYFDYGVEVLTLHTEEKKPKKLYSYDTEKNNIHISFFVKKPIELNIEKNLQINVKNDTVNINYFKEAIKIDSIYYETIKLGNKDFTTYTICSSIENNKSYSLTALKRINGFDLYIRYDYFNLQQKRVLIEALKNLLILEKDFY